MQGDIEGAGTPPRTTGGDEPACERQGAGVTIDIPVRWGDMDALGHVNNTVLFQYCEQGRIAYFDAMRLADLAEEPSWGPGLVQAELSFRRQVRYPGAVRVEVHATRAGSRSFTLAYRLSDVSNGELVAEGSSVCVWVDYHAGRALPLSAGLRGALARLEGDPALAVPAESR